MWECRVQTLNLGLRKITYNGKNYLVIIPKRIAKQLVEHGYDYAEVLIKPIKLDEVVKHE